jgi:toxin-antitoxin system PIN domain toxin
MPCIADANVLLPLLIAGHPHRKPALAWWDGQGDGEVGLCLPVRLSLLRLLSNRKVMGDSVQLPEAAWSAVEALAAQPAMVAIEAAPRIHAVYWRRNVEGREPTPNLWTDAWLAALAQSLGAEMVTFDRGFRQFRELKLRLLAPQPIHG